jgi:hypothetical protein
MQGVVSTRSSHGPKEAGQLRLRRTVLARRAKTNSVRAGLLLFISLERMRWMSSVERTHGDL